jgi:hypothetical protein
MTKHRTSSTSYRKEAVQDVDRLRKYVGKRKVSFHHRHVDDSSGRLATGDFGDRVAIANAKRVAKRQALEIQVGTIVAASVADVIHRFHAHSHRHKRS